MEDMLILQSLSYNDLLGPVEEQLRLVKIFKKLIIIKQQLRKQLDKDMPTMAL